MAARHLLFIDHAAALGGAELALLLLLEHLDRARFAPHVAAPPGALAAAARAQGLPVHELPLAQLRASVAAPLRLARDARALARIVRGERIELIQVNTVRAGPYGALAARLTGRPLLWFVHDILAPGLYTRAMCATASEVIAVSAAAARALPCAARAHVIHNGVSLDAFAGDRQAAAAALRAAWGVPPDAMLVGQVARLQAWKGQRDVLAAAAALRVQCPDVHFALVGGNIFGDDDAYVRELHAVVEQQRLGDRVHLAGHRDDIPSVLAALDMLVHASDREPFGRILIEAGAAALPIVAYADGAVGEILAHERTGLLVAPGDVAALAAAIRRLVADRALGRRLGDNARADVAARFDIRQLAPQVERVIDAALEAV